MKFFCGIKGYSEEQRRVFFSEYPVLDMEWGRGYSYWTAEVGILPVKKANPTLSKKQSSCLCHCTVIGMIYLSNHHMFYKSGKLDSGGMLGNKRRREMCWREQVGS